jgi:hypothetical protein
MGVWMTIRFNDVHAIKLISQTAHMQFVPILHQCVAEYDTRDILKGGILFTDFMNGSIQMHIAGFRPNWGSKALVYLGFHYPFRQLGVKKVIGLVPEYNWKSRNLSLHLGFRIEYLVEDVFNHHDAPNGMYIMSMTREQCRWLNMRPPHIEIAPPERMNRIDLPLSIVDHTQMTIQ